MISEEEKERRKEYNTNLNMFLADCDDEYIEWRLSHKTDVDYLNEKWINGEMELDELIRLTYECLDNGYVVLD